MRFLAKEVGAVQGGKNFLDHSKIMFSKLAEIDFPGITFTKKFKVRNWSDLAGSHEISTHARETTQKSVSLMANPRDLATMTMYRYTKYWFVKI